MEHLETPTSHDEWLLLCELANLQQRMQEVFHKEVLALAPELERLDMADYLADMKLEVLQDTSPSLEAAKAELNTRLNNRPRPDEKTATRINLRIAA